MGKAAHDAPASGGEFLPVQGKILAINARAFLGGDAESEDGAFDFCARRLDGLAGFLSEGAGEFLLALGHERDNLAKDALAFEGGQAARGAKRFYRGCDCRFCMLVCGPASREQPGLQS